MTHRRGRFGPGSVASAVLFASCVPTEQLELPVDRAAGTLILAFERGERVDVEVVDLAATPYRRAATLAPGTRVTALVYPESPRALDLEAGTLALVVDGARGVPSTPGRRLYEARVGRDDRATWTEVSAPSAGLAAFRFAGRSLAECLVDPGCRSLADARDGRCPQRCAVPAEPTPPARPALPDFSGCPAGWSVSSDTEPSGLLRCEPPVYPTVTATSCGALAYRAPGDPGCRAIGTPCGSDGWPLDLPGDARVWFVRAGSVAGDGTRAAPFGDLAAAVRVAGAGDTVALAPGRYAYAAPLVSDLRVRGSCASDTVLEDSALAPALTVVGAEVTLSNLSVAGAAGVLVSGGALALEGVAIEVAGDALEVTGAALAVSDLVVRGGTGLNLVASTATIAGAALLGVQGTALSLDGGARARVERLAVLGGAGRGRDAVAIRVDGGATATVATALIEHAGHGVGVATGSLTLRDAMLRRLTSGPAGGGDGISAACGARVSVERVVFDGVPIAMVTEGLSTTLTDVVLRDPTGARVDPAREPVLLSVADARRRCGPWPRRFTARRLRVEDLTGGVLLAAGDAAMELEDVVVRGRTGSAPATYGLNGAPAQLTLRRGLFEGIVGTAVYALRIEDEAPVVHLEDTTVRRSGSSRSASVHLATARSAELVRVRVEDADGDGVRVEHVPFGPEAGGRAVLRDVSVAGATNHGLSLNNAVVELERGHIDGAAAFGVFLHTDTRLDARALVIEGPAAGEGAVALACRGSFGSGLGGEVTRARVAGFRFSGDGRGTGVAMANGASVSLAEGLLDRHRVGAEVLGSADAAPPLAGDGTVLFRDVARPLSITAE